MIDLERFWDDIFSEDAALIAAAWASLDESERESVTAHLRAVSADPDRHLDQRRAANVALSVILPVPQHVNYEILLASGSPRRRELIALLGLPFSITSANVDEMPHPGEDPATLAVRLSREKARAALSNVQPHSASLWEPWPPTSNFQILLTADTTVSLDGESLGKPADAAEARSMLTRLRDRSHQVFTAITLVDVATGRQITDLGRTDVPLRDFSDADMEAYVATGDPFDKAGSYAIQHNGFNPVVQLNGCYANVVGLPLCHVVRSLRKLGVGPPADVPSACQVHLNYECPVYQTILAESEK